MKVLNLYAGIGGNASEWDRAKYHVTAVENNPVLAKVYQDRFPEDTVIIADAHEFLMEHYKEFDIIWSSTPCQTHSSFRQNICVKFRGTPAVYPDMRLYQEIIFLQHNFDGLWVVENVVPYYKPLIEGKKLQRHMFWSNFDIPDKEFETEKLRAAQIPDLQKLHKVDLSGYKIPNKRQVLRNCVLGELGKYVLDCAEKKLNQLKEVS